MTPLLSVKALNKSFGGNQAIRDLSFELTEGQRCAIIGPNGAGKSTLFNLIGGQLPADGGAVALDGRTLNGLRPGKRHGLGLGRSFQIGAVFRSMTLEENLITALAAAKRTGLGPRVGPGHRKKAHSLLASVGLETLAERQSSALAYGDVKRLELAMALAGRPRLLLMDEPTAGMAHGERQELMALVVELATEQQITLFFTEHDMDVVFDHAERILVLDRGALIADGAPAEVRDDPEVRRVYLGEAF